MYENFVISDAEGKIVECNNGKGRREAVAFFWELVRSRKPFSISFDGRYSFHATHETLPEPSWLIEGNNLFGGCCFHFDSNAYMWHLIAGDVTDEEDVIEETYLIEKAIKAVYSLYKIDWMRRISPERQMEACRECFENLDEYMSWEQNLETYLSDAGYGGELYACFEEFCETELTDKGYVRHLIGDCSPLSEQIEKYWGLAGIP